MKTATLVNRAAAIVVAVLFSLTLARAQAPVNAGGDISPDYKVSPEDIMTISVVGEKDLTQDCKVTKSGTITFAWLSNVEVIGKTAAQVEQMLREALDKDYLVNPTVLVALKEYRTREMSVIGEVQKPGAVAIPAERRMTIVEAIAKAQGLTARGNANNIEYTPVRTGKKIRLRLDELKAISDPSRNIFVEPGDIIEVGKSVL